MAEYKGSIIIVNWNTRGRLANCLAALVEESRKEFFSRWKTIVVDNGSTDGSGDFIRQDYPDVFLIENPENYLYTCAINQGLEAAAGNFVLLLNSDVEMSGLAVDHLANILLENSDRIASYDKGTPFKTILRRLRAAGYFVFQRSSAS